MDEDNKSYYGILEKYLKNEERMSKILLKKFN